MTTDYNDGKWHEWRGGERPVRKKTEVQVLFRGDGGGKIEGSTNIAKEWEWDHADDPYDIVWFRVVKPYREPQVRWINEYPTGASAGHKSEKEAREWARPHATRIAVRYVETPE